MTLDDARPRWRPDFSLGNLLTIATLVLAAGVGWVRMEEQQRHQAGMLVQMRTDIALDVAALRAGIVANAAEIKAAEGRIRGVEVATARGEVQYGNIMSMLSSIDGRLQRIEGRGAAAR